MADITGQFIGTAGNIIGLIIKIIAGILGIGIVAVGMWMKKKSNMYNIPVTIWIPRSDGKITDEVQAKGGFPNIRNKDGGNVTVFRLKRKGKQSIDMPPPASRFFVGLKRKLYLIQKGIDDFEPVLPDSFRFVETQEGKKVPVTDLKCINQDATAWVEDNRENARKRFTLHNFWEQYKDFIQITIFIFIVMLTLYVNWTAMQEVVTGLQEVAKSLSSSAGSVSVGK